MPTSLPYGSAMQKGPRTYRVRWFSDQFAELVLGFRRFDVFEAERFPSLSIGDLYIIEEFNPVQDLLTGRSLECVVTIVENTTTQDYGWSPGTLWVIGLAVRSFA